MKGDTLIRLWVVMGILAFAGSASAASSVEDQVKHWANVTTKSKRN
jgi:hypothetical protein